MSLKSELTKDQQKALEENDGFIEGFSYVIMTKDVYRQTMGIGTDEELAASIKAIEQGLADVEAGRVRPFQEFISEMRNGNDT